MFVGPAHFVRPYYRFQPRVSIGFGLWAGYPFAYPHAFYNPAYSYPYPYYPDTYVSPYFGSSTYSDTSGYVDAQPDQANMGGVSFEITPDTAQVLVDGTLVGTVADFTPSTQPLGLTAGRHHVEVSAPGYQTLSFDVDIIAGQVIPYQGSLDR